MTLSRFTLTNLMYGLIPEELLDLLAAFFVPRFDFERLDFRDFPRGPMIQSRICFSTSKDGYLQFTMLYAIARVTFEGELSLRPSPMTKNSRMVKVDGYLA